MTLLAKARQEFLHTFDGVASLMLRPTFLVLVVLEISERLDHKLGTRTSGTCQREMVDGRKREITSSYRLDVRCSIVLV